MSDAEKTIDSMSFEDAMEALEKIVSRLETGEAPLEESISLYERGDRLRKHCEAKLKAAEMKVAQITEGPDGPEARPAEFG
jgi:exodeoxyribonuclease VII small subunit